MYLSISESTVSKQQGNFPFLENICGKYFLSRIHLLVSLCSSSIIWIQNFIFCVQDVGFKDFSRKGENSTFIRVSSSHTLGFKRSITSSDTYNKRIFWNPISNRKKIFFLVDVNILLRNLCHFLLNFKRKTDFKFRQECKL